MTPAGQRVVDEATAALMDIDFGLDALDEPARSQVFEHLRSVRLAAGDVASG